MTQKTNIQKVIEKAEDIASESNLNLTINLDLWHDLPQLGYLNPKILVFSIYLYNQYNIRSETDIKKAIKDINLNRYKNIIDIIISKPETNDYPIYVKILKSIVIKYLVNMLNFRKS